jgi:hypothetical protein
VGLDPDYPAVRINDPNSTVDVWDGHHQKIGMLGPDDIFHSSAVNVTCFLSRSNGTWYKLLNADGWDKPATSAYVSAALTQVMQPTPWPVPACVDNHDQPGPRGCLPRVIMAAGLFALVFAVIAAIHWLWRHRRR